jgi:uncharacterized protein YdhG (YjbR/CyaY superfamily)
MRRGSWQAGANTGQREPKGGHVAEHFTTINDYIASCPAEVRRILEEIRRTIRSTVPEAGETISYGMPTFTLDGKYFVYVAAWKHYVSLYPVPPAQELDADLERELAPYRAAKATLRFQLAKPIPYELIRRLAALLVERHSSRGIGAADGGPS